MPDEIVHQTYAKLREHFSGDLRFDEHFRPVKYVIAPDGSLITNVMAAMLSGFNMVLFVPDNSDGALQLQVTIEPFEEDETGYGALADRWRIYHGEPEDVFWGKLYIDAAKFDEHVIDGEALMRENPLEKDMGRLCKLFNSEHRSDVKLLCEKLERLEVSEPVVVGVDAWGIDVRRRFDVVRLPFASPQKSAEEALAEFNRMVERATA